MSFSDVIGAEMTAIMGFIWFTHRTACRPVYRGEILYAQDLALMRLFFLGTVMLLIHQLVYAAYGVYLFGYQSVSQTQRDLVHIGGFIAIGGFLLYTSALDEIRLYVLPPKSVAPDEEAQLVQTGPYRFSRNPMYVSYLLVFLGVELVVLSPLATATIPLFLAFRSWIKEEEADQRSLHGKSFATYCRRVPRWFSLPNFIAALRRALYLY